MITKELKTKRIKQFAQHEGDTGSSQVQIALLTQKIENLTQHLNKHKKDFGSKRGLLNLVSQRKKCLQYLHKTDIDTYKKIIEQLNLRSTLS